MHRPSLAGQVAERRRGPARRNVESRAGGISAWAAIIAVPTAITGIYGMNFRYMPELEHRWGYPVALLVILAAVAGLYVLFKRSRRL